MTASALGDTLARLDRSRVALRLAVDEVAPALRDRAPGVDRWSVAGVLEHLALVEARYAANLAGAMAPVPATSAQAGAPGDPLLPPPVEAMLADRTSRRTAIEPVQPRGMDWRAALERAEAAREALRTLLHDAAARDWSRLTLEHPRFGAMNAFQWGQFLSGHESRHTEQIREISEQLAGESHP